MYLVIICAPFVIIVYYHLVLTFIHQIFDIVTVTEQSAARFASIMLTLLVAVGLAFVISEIYTKRKK